ncbi:MAG: hypothetical protein PHG27_07240 [Massilibacteroides sp.]|nr:hypothetical protein [Massilibacteroides sp.]MDD4115373.1 hypothetical protein [Massilibacteroides sp.]MDD4661394.1 hypothetical protein [Massilibacteroides sp.]
MIEQFYSIKHLSTEQLRELFSSYRSQGWVDYDYYKLMPEGVTPPQLTDEEILFNMDGTNTHNYFVFMQGMEDEKDGIMIGFGLTDYPLLGAFLHLDESLLDEIVNKYGLKATNAGVDYSWLGNNSSKRLLN